MKNEAVELVEWNRSKIEEAALAVIGFYAQALAVLGTSQWVKFALEDILPAVRGETSRPVELQAWSFNLTFHAPRPVHIPIIDNGVVIWRERDPRFIFTDSSKLVLAPRLRDRLYKANKAIGEEVEDVYKLRVMHIPFTLAFPKEGYADKIAIVTGALAA
ncbi:hypothetical protein HYS91_05290 [Candidatus Daviesbacteria bacterium]|nr:hypothetical protein [Candidatus Daviesbacteria bacterium]